MPLSRARRACSSNAMILGIGGGYPSCLPEAVCLGGLALPEGFVATDHGVGSVSTLVRRVLSTALRAHPSQPRGPLLAVRRTLERTSAEPSAGDFTRP